MEMKKAANSPALDLPVTSVARRWVAMAVNPENSGARNTHTFLISIGMSSLWQIQ